MKRRPRIADPIASPAGVRRVLDSLREISPVLIPTTDRKVFTLLNAVRHVGRYRATDKPGGRPAKFDREDLLAVDRALRTALEKNGRPNLSVASFVGFYLPILRYPADVGEALAQGKINLLEAAQLTRLTPEKLGVDAREARRVRRETLLLRTRLAASQADLRRRVTALIKPFNDNLEFADAAADEMIEVGDGRHLFYEQLKQVHQALQIIRPDDLDDATLEDILGKCDRLMRALHRRPEQKWGDGDSVVQLKDGAPG
jgi:hypothetical protein